MKPQINKIMKAEKKIESQVEFLEISMINKDLVGYILWGHNKWDMTKQQQQQNVSNRKKICIVKKDRKIGWWELGVKGIMAYKGGEIPQKEKVTITSVL